MIATAMVMNDWWLYKVLLLLHILVSVVGFGGVILNGIYANEAKKRQGPTGRAVSEANYSVSMIAEKFIYLVPVFGILMVLASDGAVEFEETWIWVSILLYVAAIGVSHAIVIPAHRSLNESLLAMESAEPGPPPAAFLKAQKQLQTFAPILHLALVAILVLMIWKPG